MTHPRRLENRRKQAVAIAEAIWKAADAETRHSRFLAGTVERMDAETRRHWAVAADQNPPSDECWVLVAQEVARLQQLLAAEPATVQ